MKKHPGLDVVLVDFANPQVQQDSATDEFLAIVQYPKLKVSQKKKPTVFLRGDLRVTQIKASHINEKSNRFETSFIRETGLRPILSVHDLAENLKRFNKSLNDTTIVYCKGSSDDDM